MLQFSNISESKIIEKMKAQDQYKDLMLANVSHDLRSPINGMIGMIEEIKD